ncbi:MAG: HNH endonuclease [Deltaproteobacteria bacterium]|nr:HNH endonuclease [Deltaproteobacteria bacterium]
MLTIELVPRTAWYKNLRSELSKEQWDELRRASYKAAGYRCEICGGKGDKWPVEAHEIWEYDDKKHIQKLIGIISLCPLCHKVKHIGLAQMNGEYDIVLRHLAKVNGWDLEEAEDYINKQINKWKDRSQYEWELNIDWLESV